MKFSEFSGYLQKLEATSSMLEMTSILASLFKEAKPDEIRQIVYLSLGEMAPLYEAIRFNLAEKMMVRVASRVSGEGQDRVVELFKEVGDLGKVIAALRLKIKNKKSKIKVLDVYDGLLEVAREEGGGSQERKIAKLAELLGSLDPLSAKYVVRIVLGKLRLGFADKTVLDALSWMGTGDKSLRQPLERAYNVCPDIGLIAEVFKKGGLNGLAKIKIEIGRPLLPQRCQRVKTAEEILEKMGGKTAAEPKFDGERIQLHLDRNRQATLRVGDFKPEGLGNRRDSAQGRQAALELEGFEKPGFLIKAFTRNLDDVSHMFPDLLRAAAEQIKAESVILDGEALGYDVQTGKFVPFQVTSTRKRKYGVGEKIKEVPVKLFVFDLLYKDGRSFLEKPFTERRRVLESVIDSGDVVKPAPQVILDNPAAIDSFLEEELNEGLEGLVLKNLEAPYEAGGRGFAWIKLKGEKETVDVVVLGYYAGEGRRAGFGIGGILAGVYDEETDVFKTVSKVGSGLTDKQFPEMRRRCDKLCVKKKPTRVDVPKELVPDVWVEPKMVVAVRHDEISKSPLHSSGYALRFPRMVAWREDKVAEETTTVGEIEKMYDLQFAG